MDQFKAFLLKNHAVTLKVASHYIKWILGCYHFNNQEIGPPVEEGAIRHYLKHLASDHEDWQVEQARKAINLYCYFLDKAGKSVVSPSAPANREWQQAIDQMVKAMRLKHLSYRTEQTYLTWMRSFYSFLNGTSPWQLESRDVMSFLTHLAVERKVAKSTQNLAFNAILFFFRRVLDKDRQTMFPESIADEIRLHIEKVREMHLTDRKAAIPGVHLPGALDKKYPNASIEWVLHWVFPSVKLSQDPRTGLIRRHDMSSDVLRKVFEKRF